MENNNKPVVNLISRPDNMLKVVYTACRTCYSADYPINIYESTDDEEKMLKLIEKVISSGHYSTIEHINVERLYYTCRTLLSEGGAQTPQRKVQLCLLPS